MEEKILIASAQQGNAQAFDELIKESLPKLKSLLCKHYNLQSTDFDDIIQIGINKAWLKIGNFRGDSAFLTWLYTILRNETLNFVKRRLSLDKKEISAHSTVDEEGELDYEHILAISLEQKNDDDAQSIVERQETLATYRQIIEDVLSKLTPIHREIIKMVIQDEMSYKEISKHLNIPIGTVMSRLYFARRHAQKLIKQYAHKHELALDCVTL